MFKNLGFVFFLAMFGFNSFSEDPVETIHLEVSNCEEALAVAQDEGRRVYLLFKGEDCQWCERQSSEMVKPEYSRAMDGMIFCVVDVADRKDVAAKYRVSLVPSHRVLDPEGKVLKSSTGYMDATRAARFLAP